MQFVTPVTLSIRPSYQLLGIYIVFIFLVCFSLFSIRLPIYLAVIIALGILWHGAHAVTQHILLSNPHAIVKVNRSPNNNWQFITLSEEAILIEKVQATLMGTYLIVLNGIGLDGKRSKLLVFRDQLSSDNFRILSALLRCDRGKRDKGLDDDD